MNKPSQKVMNACRLSIVSVSVWLWLATVYSHAADISCFDIWGPAAVNSNFDQLFLSGRRPSEQTCKTILIQGTIESGDAQKFVQLLSKNHPFVQKVYIASSGGSVFEALKIGRMVRRDLLRTGVPYPRSLDFVNGAPSNGIGEFQDLMTKKMICEGPRCHCASACFLIWAGGIVRIGHVLGLHAPSINSTAFSNLPPDRAGRLYRDLILQIDHYLEEVHVPRKYRDIMSDIASNDIRWLTFKEVTPLADPASIQTWIAASCRALTKQEWDILGDLDFAKKRSVRDQLLFETLDKKRDEFLACKERKLDNARDAVIRIDDQN